MTIYLCSPNYAIPPFHWQWVLIFQGMAYCQVYYQHSLYLRAWFVDIRENHNQQQMICLITPMLLSQLYLSLCMGKPFEAQIFHQLLVKW